MDIIRRYTAVIIVNPKELLVSAAYSCHHQAVHVRKCEKEYHVAVAVHIITKSMVIEFIVIS